MSRLYEMCNDIDSTDVLRNKEGLTVIERERLVKNMKHAGIISLSNIRISTLR